MHLLPKLLSLKVTLILKSFQSPLKASCEEEGEGIIACVLLVTTEDLEGFWRKICIQSLWMQVILERIFFMLVVKCALMILFKDTQF